ncbi:MAG: VWA domain-containing protein [Chloroflexi bacterium]|nr:VWA domain-containing protein [Chloroflexota bacterium]
MSFGAPAYLWLLLLVPALSAIAAVWVRWRGRARARFGHAADARGASYVTATVAIAAVALASLAAARPQAGERDAAVEDRGIDLAIVLDVSQSMLADDVQPSRLALAQQELAVFVDRLRGDRTGIVIFAKDPFVRSPLTPDMRAVRALIEGIGDERGLVEPGSDLGAAVRAGQRLLAGGEADTKAMLIVSDGEDHGAGVAAAIVDAKAAGIRIYTAGAGTARGAPVRDVDPETLQLHDRIDDAGEPVLTRLDAAALRTIAAAGDGRYIDLTDGERPLSSLAPELHGLARTRFADASSARPIERFQLFAAAALALAVAGLVSPLLRSGRGHSRWRGLPQLWRGLFSPRFWRWWPLAGVALIAAVCSSGVADVNRAGNRDYAAGNFDDAIARYKTAQALAPGRPEPYYNAGNAFNGKGEFGQAIEEAHRALDAASQDHMIAAAEYALGNHYAAADRPRDARDAYLRALLAAPGDDDARHNLELMEARLQASPTPTPEPRREPTPPGGTPGAQGGTPEPGGSSGTPAATPGEGTPQPSGSAEPSAEDLQRRLEDALEGIEGEFSEQDALRILDLLAQTNRRAIDRPVTGAGASNPDY